MASSFVWNSKPQTPATTTQSTMFGTATPTTAGTGGGLFGGFGTQGAAVQQSNTSGFGSGTGGGGLFGGFGTQPKATTSAFGTAAAGGGVFGGFGTQVGTVQPNANASTAVTAFGNSNSTFGTSFNSTLGSGAPSFFGAATSTPFTRAQQPTPGFGMFNQNQAAGSSQQSTSWMGQNSSFQQTQPATVGSVFGTSGFGGAAGTTQVGQQNQQQQTFHANQHQQQTPTFGVMNSTVHLPRPSTPLSASLNQQAAIHNSVFNCYIYGDERDGAISNLNYVQACRGLGRAYFSPNHPPVPITPDNNSMYRFLGLTYSHLIKETNHDGHVTITIKKPFTQVREEETQLLSTIHSLIGTQEIFFTVKGYTELDENTTTITIHADDKITLRRFSSTELASTLLQAHIKPLLERLGIVNIQMKVRPSAQELNEYLDVPPPGISLPLWKKALDQNPDPENMIPTVIIGPAALKSRLIAQRNYNTKQSEALKGIEADVTKLRDIHSTYPIQLQEIRRQHAVLSHRILLAMLKRLMLEKRGLPLDPTEVSLIKPLEELNREFSLKNNVKDRLTKLTEKSFELLQQTKTEGSRAMRNHSSLDPATLEQIKYSLQLQQAGITHLYNTVKEDEWNVQMLNLSMDEIRQGNFQTQNPN